MWELPGLDWRLGLCGHNTHLGVGLTLPLNQYVCQHQPLNHCGMIGNAQHLPNKLGESQDFLGTSNTSKFASKKKKSTK